MPPTNPNRKSFVLGLSLPLGRYSSDSRPSKDRSRKAISSPSRELFTSPRASMFPPSQLKQEQPFLPLCFTDGLDPSEKMKLLRKTKKLSRILGETPIPVAVNEFGTPTEALLGLSGIGKEPGIPSSAKHQQLSISLMGSLKRSITVGHGRVMKSQPSGVQRARSLASFPPPLPTAVSAAQPSQIASESFLSGETIERTASAESNNVQEAAPSLGAKRNSLLSLSSVATARRRDSTASSFLIVERSPEQLQRVRAAKLTRQLGENVPPDVLLRASSPPPRITLVPTSSFVSFAGHSMDAIDRQGSVRSTVHSVSDSRRRRLSLDVQPLVERNPGTASSDSLVQRLKGCSGSHKTRPHTADSINQPLAHRHSKLDDLYVYSDYGHDSVRVLSPEKQRALNVRRARKMAQMFGNDPPPALFQITNAPARVADDPFSDTLAERTRCDSHVTLISVTPSEKSTQPGSKHDDGRPSQESTRNLSPLIFANPSSMSSDCQSVSPYPGDISEDSHSDILPYLTEHDSASDICPASPLDLPPLAYPLTYSSQTNISVTSSRSTPGALSEQCEEPLASPTRSIFQVASPTILLSKLPWSAPTRSVSAPTSPPTMHSQLAPLTSLSATPTGTTSVPELSPSSPMFRMRRLRAAKLSRFFGVGLNDITGMLVSTDTLSGAPLGRASANPSISASPLSVSISTHSSSCSLSQRPRPRPLSHHESELRSEPPLDTWRMPSTETFSAPSSPRSSRAFVQIEPENDNHDDRSRHSSGGRRSRSTSRAAPRPVQSLVQPRWPSGSSVLDPPAIADRGSTRSQSEPQVLFQAASSVWPQPKLVEIASECRSPKYFFRESRQPPKTKEMEMEIAIKQLRKMK